MIKRSSYIIRKLLIRKHGQVALRKPFSVRQEARDHSLANAKVCAKCRKKILRNTKVHIRRGYIVTANIKDLDDIIRFFDFAKKVNDANHAKGIMPWENQFIKAKI